jgi:hypothetical protein
MNMKDHLWDLLDHINGWKAQFLFGQVSLIIDISQSYV